ncbi:NAD-dependent epimerase/dehydratase family protein [Cupriavidus cauae]|uniref:NAD-dependent epimerase/dehydratase family protein n=1 Tax=Cupriavidus cauae TaxID=2608999 RepID=A0A5M8AVU1_9BURK|nr:NAD-dependent epimerase/dehydratase family protein [Cupriavidus cauae]KAA6126959.1 NAD-dependent epimerase/dehydratase family protein [Cupriavidus cauae]UZN52322.1 NAD-dependent epimerase/dehydratase family protein [Cupriavidus cauae]
MTEKTVLVTGARGFFGGYVVEHYLAAGWRVVGLGHGSPGSACAGRVVWHQAPVSLERLERLEIEPDLLVHCAGGGSVSASLRDPFGDHARTVDTTAAVLEYIRRHCPRTPVVYPSSAAVYGNAAHLPASEGSTAPLRPASPYGMHKLMAEQLCASYGAHFGVSVAVVRFFSLFGEGQRKQLLWDACRKIGQRDDLYCGTGEESRDWLHAEDAARLVAAVAAQASPACPIYNGASGTTTTVRQVLTLLYRDLAPSRHPRFSLAVRHGDPCDQCADIGHTLSTGWAPQIRLETGVRRYAQWFEAVCDD